MPADLWRPDDVIGRISLPLSSLDLTPGEVNDLWLPVPRNGKRIYDKKGGSGSGSIDELPTRVHALQVEGSDAAALVAPREDTAAGFTASGSNRPSPPAAKPASPQLQAAGPGPQRSPAHGSPGLQHLSSGAAAMQQLRQLAANPLDALRSKRCLLHITASYLPLTEQEIAAVARAADTRRHAEAATPRRANSSAALSSGRLNDLLHRCGQARQHCVHVCGNMGA